jgi:hypothetical protein
MKDQILTLVGKWEILLRRRFTGTNPLSPLTPLPGKRSYCLPIEEKHSVGY